MVEKLDPNNSWENLKAVRNAFLKKTKSSSCTYLLTNNQIKTNIRSFKSVVKSSTSFLQKNLTKDVINSGAKMFLYLNSCPKTKSKLRNFETYFSKVFHGRASSFVEPTNSGTILYLLKAMKLFPNDERVIVSKVLEKFLSHCNLPIPSYNRYKFFHKDKVPPANGKLISA